MRDRILQDFLCQERDCFGIMGVPLQDFHGGPKIKSLPAGFSSKVLWSLVRLCCGSADSIYGGSCMTLSTLYLLGNTTSSTIVY